MKKRSAGAVFSLPIILSHTLDKNVHHCYAHTFLQIAVRFSRQFPNRNMEEEPLCWQPRLVRQRWCYAWFSLVSTDRSHVTRRCTVLELARQPVFPLQILVRDRQPTHWVAHPRSTRHGAVVGSVAEPVPDSNGTETQRFEPRLTPYKCEVEPCVSSRSRQNDRPIVRHSPRTPLVGCVTAVAVLPECFLYRQSRSNAQRRAHAIEERLAHDFHPQSPKGGDPIFEPPSPSAWGVSILGSFLRLSRARTFDRSYCQ